MGVRADEAAAETPPYRYSPTTTIGTGVSTDDIEADLQWEVLKAGIPGYVDPYEKAKKIQEKKLRDEQKTAPVTSSASSRPSDNEPQRCHSCGWIGVPRIYQRCPSCDGRNILSQAFAEDFIDMNRIADEEDFIDMNRIADEEDSIDTNQIGRASCRERV